MSDGKICRTCYLSDLLEEVKQYHEGEVEVAEIGVPYARYALRKRYSYDRGDLGGATIIILWNKESENNVAE